VIEFPYCVIVTGNLRILGRRSELESRATENRRKEPQKNCILGTFGHGVECLKAVSLIPAICTLAWWQHYMRSDLLLTDVPYYYI
jgi:hypothetical protein